MLDWYALTFLSFGFYVIQGLLMKYVTKIGCDRHLITFYYSLTVALLSLPVIFLRGSFELTLVGLIVAAVNGVSYALANINRFAALKDLPVAIVYPIVRLNNVIVVILFILFLGETVTFSNIVGIILATLSVYFITQGDDS